MTANPPAAGRAARGGRRTWRRWLIAGLVVVLMIPLGLAGAVGLVWARAVTDTVGQVAFERPLAIPPLAESRVEDGTRVVDLRAGKGTTDFGVADTPAETWGYNGSYLGRRCAPNAANGYGST